MQNQNKEERTSVSIDDAQSNRDLHFLGKSDESPMPAMGHAP
jgi:hypothetical protein